MGELKPDWAQAQQAVIGSMLIDENCVGLVMQQTTPEHFSDGGMRHLYEAVRGLWLEHAPVDPVTVLHAAGPAYEKPITALMQATPTAANIEAYLEILHDCARLSVYRAAADRILTECRTADEAAQVWEALGRELMGRSKVRCVTMSEAITRYLDRMNDQTPPDTISLGIERLDRLLNLGRGKFLILAADSSAGKTALALQFAYHIASTGKKIGFFSLETDNDTLTDRLMAEVQVAGINLPRSKAKALSTADYQRAVDAGQRSARVPLCLIDNCETLDKIRAWTIQQGFEVIVVDYLQLIDEEGDKRWDVVTRISMALHRMAQTLGVTVIGLSQVTPPDKTQKKALTMDDLRESRQLKHDADVILLLELCDEFPNGRTLTIAKNKDGRRNKGMKLNFDPEHMTFSFYKRVQPSEVPGQGAPMWAMGDDEGGENPF